MTNGGAVHKLQQITNDVGRHPGVGSASRGIPLVLPILICPPLYYPLVAFSLLSDYSLRCPRKVKVLLVITIRCIIAVLDRLGFGRTEKSEREGQTFG